MIQRQLNFALGTIQPLRGGVIRRGEITLVEDIVGTQCDRGGLRGLPLQRQVSGGVGGQSDRVGIVGIALADILQAAAGGPCRQGFL